MAGEEAVLAAVASGAVVEVLADSEGDLRAAAGQAEAGSIVRI